MVFIWLLLMPIVLVNLSLKLSKLAYTIVAKDVGSERVKGNKRGVRRQLRDIKRTSFKLVKSSAKVLYYTLKAILWFFRIIASLFTALGIVNILVIVTLVIGVLVGTLLVTSYDDEMDFSLKSSSNQGVHLNSKDINEYSNVGSINSLARVDMNKLNFKLGNSDHKENLSTRVLRSDFTDLAYLLVSGDNSFNNYRGKSASKYIGYMFGGYHYLNYEASVGTYVDTMSNKPNLKELKLISTEIISGYRAGVKFSEHRTIFMDCSGFVAWMYATIFSSVDSGNENLDTLANWFYGSSSSSNYKSGYNCKEISFFNLKPGDILVKSYMVGDELKGHAGIVISNKEYIHASSESAGIFISKITDGNFATSEGFLDYSNAKAYRPKIIFADD